MKRGRRSVVLFDLDGTLMNTKALYLECYRRAVEPRLRRAPSDEELMAMRPRSELRFLREVVGAEAFNDCLADFHDHYGALHDDHFGGIYEGVPELLERLRGRGHRLGLVTGKSRRSWSITAAAAPLPPFDVMVMDDDVSAAKPDPQGILAALDALNARPEQAVYVGDTISDVAAARAARVEPIAVLWGRSDPVPFEARARKHGARIARRPVDLMDLVDDGR